MADDDLWGGGEYQVVARRLMPLAERLVAAVGVKPGQEVLDVGAGTGNVAIAASRRGARVTCVEPSPGMVELGKDRTAGTDVGWHQAGVEDIPFPEARFDAVLSVMAAVFSPDARSAASELLRVVKPGGLIGLTAWTPDGFLAATMSYLRGLCGAPEPTTAWHEETFVRSTLAAASTVEVERVVPQWRFADVDAVIGFFETSAPPSVAARKQLGEQRWEEVRSHLRQQLGDLGGPLLLEASYLQIIARR